MQEWGRLNQCRVSPAHAGEWVDLEQNRHVWTTSREMSGAEEGGKEIENKDEDLPSNPLDSEDKGQHSVNLEAVVLIVELLEVALHTILCIRQVYPIGLFERRVKLGIPVFQCVDPSISEYIAKVVKSIGEEIAEGTLAKVIIGIHQSDPDPNSESDLPLEKFIFSFEYEKDEEEEESVPDADILPLDVVQRYARGMLIKLSAIDAQLLPLESSDELSFSVVMQLREETSFRISEVDLNFDEDEDDSRSKRSPGLTTGTTAVRDPALVHIIRAGSLSVCLHVQESEEKGRGITSVLERSLEVRPAGKDEVEDEDAG